ncbi:MAG TPA: hypothetical protein PLN31_05545 [Azoarcus taiwanensis]|nr:hypothetical protein [Azoarcus taiwanensis]
MTLAHLDTLRTRRAPYERLAAKRRLVRLLYERDWSKARVIGFFGVLDWMMRLPKELEAKLWQDIEQIEGERKVKYVTSVERLIIERERQLGIEEGIQKGIEKGRAEGSVGVLRRLLMARFGRLPEAVVGRLGRATAEQVEQWAERVIDAETLDDVFREN